MGFFKKLEETKLKMWFIYDYKNRKRQIKDDKKKARLYEENPEEFIR